MLNNLPPLSMPSHLGKRIQLGHVVRDLNAALHYWTQFMGVGPFVMLDSSVGNRQFFHRGQRSKVDFAIAISYLGDVMIELIAPLNSAPSPYEEFLNDGKEGLHHIGVWPADFTSACQELKKSGFTEVSSICHPDGKKDIIYCDTPASVGIMVEVADLTPVRKNFLEGIQTLANQWDGSDPVRRYADRATFINEFSKHTN